MIAPAIYDSFTLEDMAMLDKMTTLAFRAGISLAFVCLSISLAASQTGVINVMGPPFNAKCDGATDDTAAIQSAINTAFRGATHYALYVPANTPASGSQQGCVVSQINLTNINNAIHIEGDNAIIGHTSRIICEETTQNTKVCLDFTGSVGISMEHLDILAGGGTTNAPRVPVLLAKSTIGNSATIHWDDVTVEGYGDFMVYDLGGEVWDCTNCAFEQLGPGGVDLVRFSSVNTAGITSPFAALHGTPISMTQVNLHATWSAGGTSDAVAFDVGSNSTISQIAISGFGNLNSAPYFIRDNVGPTNLLNDIFIGAGDHNLRVEPTCTSCGLASFGSNVFHLEVNAQWAASASPTVTLLNLTGQVGGSDIYLRPGDTFATFPTAAVVTCTVGAGNILGTQIHDFLAFGGVPQTNNCPGAHEWNWDFTGPAISAGEFFASNTTQTGTSQNLTGTGSCATIVNNIGGTIAGILQCNSGTGPQVSSINIKPTYKAPNGWSCFGSVLGNGNVLRQSATSQTVCTLTGTVGKGDVVTFGAIGW